MLKRYETPKTIVRKYGTFLGILIVGIGGSVLLYAFLLRMFSLRNIEVAGEGLGVRIDPRKISTNLLFFPTKTLEEEILREYPLLGKVRIEKVYPHTLRISMIPRIPLAVVKNDTQSVVSDAMGMVLRDATSADLFPIVTMGGTPVHVGQKIDDQLVRTALAFLDLLRETLTVDVVTATDSALLRARIEGIDIFFVQDGNMQEYATTLQRMISGFRIRGKLPAIIDLRFSKPIVTFR